MSVERDGVRALAELARLRLDDVELHRLTGDVNRILDHVAALAEVRDVPDAHDATAWDPGAVPGGGAPAPDPLLRPPSDIAPEWRDGFFLVPRLPGVQAEDGA